MFGRDFDDLRRFGDEVALVDATGATLTYRELAEAGAAFAAKLGQPRKLVLLEVDNSIASVVAFVGALGGGHVSILAGASSDGGNARIVREFAPNVLFADGQLRSNPDAPTYDLHPDLSLLLPTSGSTGSPKLVRLSRANLASNAAAIVEYLEIAPTDRAITSLPIHYSYGMSVLTSHLHAGARVILTDLSVTHPEFWELFDREGATSLAGVPYSYELFERTGLRDNPPATLKAMTQAGGRLPPELVKAYAAFGAARGVRFYTMYGQTEASPRMAYLPPARALENSDCIGLPIPGGEFRLIDDDGAPIEAAETAGELVYTGPNVMMGYAFTPADLAKGPEHSELRTGDLAMRTKAGLYRIVGRASRFVKIAGLRIGLDDLESMLAETGRKIVAAGNDRRIGVAVLGGADTAEVRDFIAARCGLPVASIVAFSIEEVPRLSSGKTDYPSLMARADREAAKADAALEGGGAIAAGYARALGIPLPPPDASFVGLGGDSLAYVNASIAVERALGRIPDGWERMPIASLQAMAPDTPPPRRATRAVSSELVVRVLALFFITIRHASLGEANFLLGGSNVLFALAGYSLARFQRDDLLAGSVRRALWGAAYRIVLPYLVIMALFVWQSDVERSLAWPLLGSVFFLDERGPLWVYWFIESVVHALVITCGLFLIPAFRKFAAARPFGSALTMIGVASAVMLITPPLWSDGRGWHLTIDAWLYAYFIGWAAFLARTTLQKAIVLVLAAGLTAYQYDFATTRALWFTLGLAVVMFVPTIRLPSFVASAVLKLAAASYFIYLTHIIPIHLLMVERKMTPYLGVNVAILVVLCALIGLTYAWVWNRMTEWVAARMPVRPAGNSFPQRAE